MKKLKKILSLALASTLSLSAASALADAEVTVNPGETQAAGAATDDQAIAVAKLTFDIPEELSQCSYDINDSGGEQEFDITWTDPAREKSIFVTVNSRLVPTRYQNSSFDEPSGLSEIRKSALLEAAKAFLKKTVPQLADNLVYSEEESGGVRFAFNRYENGIRVEGNYARVTMSRATGNVRNYSLTWDFDSQFPAGTGPDAETAYSVLNDTAVSTEYSIFGDKAFPIYVYDGGVYVDADGSTFNPMTFYAVNKMASSTFGVEDAAAEMDGGSGGGSYRLTREEITAVEKMRSLISREKFEEIIASLPELSLPAKYELKLKYVSNVYEDRTEYTVTGNFEADDGYAEIILDAETGEIMSFYSWNNEDYRSSVDDLTGSIIADPYDSEKCRQIAKTFIEKIKDVSDYRSDSEDEGYSYNNGSRYVRYIGGIPFPSDYKSATVSPKTGKITRYYENVPRVEIVTPASMADRLTAVKNAYDAEQVYAYKPVLDENGLTVDAKPALARKLTPKTSFYALKAEDGSPIDYDGEAPEAVIQKNDEIDHPAWEAFDILRDNDITLNGSWAFDDSISKGNFDSLLNMLSGIEAIPYYYYRFETVYEDRDAPITREEAARMTAVKFGWDKLIDLDIYSVRFTDSAAFTGGVGAAAILQGLGVMSASADGSFRPADAFTYGDAFILAYNLAKAGLNAAG